MTEAPRCTVVIPTYNREGLLHGTLDSLTRQTLPADRFEVVVVDDGSSDGTAAMVAGFADRLSVRYFFQEDKGFRAAKARNVGIEHAASDVCVFIDSGVLLHSGCLAAHVRAHEAEGPVAAIGYVYGMNPDNAEAELINAAVAVDDPDITAQLLRGRGQGLDIRELFYARYGEEIGDLPAPWLLYWTANVSASTAQLRAVGMFDEEFTTWGGEDVDLGYRLHRDGARFVADRRAVAVHRPHEKVMGDHLELVAANYEHMRTKYRSPIITLLTEVPPEGIFDLNDIIRQRGLTD